MSDHFAAKVCRSSLGTLCLWIVLMGCKHSNTNAPSAAEDASLQNPARHATQQLASGETAARNGQVSSSTQATDRVADSVTANDNRPAESPLLNLPTPETRSKEQPRRDIAEVTQQASVFVDVLDQLYPNDPDALEVRARYYLMLGRLQPAKLSWEKAIQIDSKYGYAYTGLGTVAMRDSDYDAAIGFLKTAVELMPGEQYAAHELSSAYIKKGDVNSAIDVLQNQLKQKPNAYDTLQLLGQARLVNREYEMARDAFQRSLDVSPQNYLAQQGLSASLLRMGQREEASKWIELQKNARSSTNISNEIAQAAERTDISTRLVQVARVFLKQNRPDLAKKTLEYACGCSESHVESRTLLIQVLAQEKLYDAAMEWALELTQIQPANASYWLTAGTLALRRRQLAQADEYFSKAIELAPQRVEAYGAMVEAHVVLNGDKAKAMAMAKKTTELRGAASDYATYAQTLSMNNKKDEAIAALKKAIELDPEADSFKRILDSLQGGRQ